MPDPGDGGRRGVGNVSKDIAPLGDGGQGDHAITVGALLGSPFIPPDAIEANTDPIYCDGTPGNPGPAALP